MLSGFLNTAIAKPAEILIHDFFLWTSLFRSFFTKHYSSISNHSGRTSDSLQVRGAGRRDIPACRKVMAQQRESPAGLLVGLKRDAHSHTFWKWVVVQGQAQSNQGKIPHQNNRVK